MGLLRTQSTAAQGHANASTASSNQLQSTAPHTKANEQQLDLRPLHQSVQSLVAQFPHLDASQPAPSADATPAVEHKRMRSMQTAKPQPVQPQQRHKPSMLSRDITKLLQKHKSQPGSNTRPLARNASVLRKTKKVLLGLERVEQERQAEVSSAKAKLQPVASSVAPRVETRTTIDYQPEVELNDWFEHSAAPKRERSTHRQRVHDQAWAERHQSTAQPTTAQPQRAHAVHQLGNSKSSLVRKSMGSLIGLLFGPKRLLAFSMGSVAAIALFHWNEFDATQSTVQMPLPTIEVEAFKDAITPDLSGSQQIELVVKNNSTFSSLLAEHPFSSDQKNALFREDLAVTWLSKRLQPGKEIVIDHHDWEIQRIVYPIDVTKRLVATWDYAEARFNVAIETAEVLSQPAYVEGSIERSFYADALKQGMQESLILSVAGIYQWDVDFVNDIRIGDTFQVLYTQDYMGDRKLPPNEVLAAQLAVRGTPIMAIAFNPDAYIDGQYKGNVESGANFYTPDGKLMRKSFLRMPLEFGRVSSGFNPNRIHPLFGTKRPHRGTDYAAPRHTPILAVAGGVVTRVAWGTGYGRRVEIDHGNGISTLYAHMQKYGTGIKPGVRVKQGQAIGTVGTSGWATGPHVHYEFKVNGVHKNPETVKLPSAPSLPQDLMPVFNQHKEEMLAMFSRFVNRGSMRAGG